MRLLCSYASEDAAFRRELRVGLAALRRTGVIEYWDDREIAPGSQWEEVIHEKLDKFDVIVFLVSGHLIGSNYVMEVEFKRALERRREGVQIIALLLRDIDYEGTAFASLELMAKPKDGDLRAIENWKPKSTAYKIVSKAIRQYAQKSASREQPASDHDALDPPRRIWSLPQRRRLVVGRERVIAAVYDNLWSPLGQRRVALVGAGGCGKTTIAHEYAWHYRDGYDVVAWIESENATTLNDDCTTLAVQLGLSATDGEASKAELKNWLQDHVRWLLVFDNAVNVHDVRERLPETIGGHVIVTSRESIWGDFTTEMPLDRLGREDAARLLVTLTGDGDYEAALELAALLDDLPKALTLAAAAVRQRRISLRDYIRDLGPSPVTTP